MRFGLLLVLFYGITIMNCYGQKPVLSYITVLENGNVIINWIPDETVSGYEIYRSKTRGNQAGFNTIAVVNGSSASQYIDTDVDAREMSIGYKVQYLNGTLLSDPHYTLFLEQVEYDSCTMTNTLRWNNYLGWSNGFQYSVICNESNVTSSDLEFDADTVFTHSVQQGVDYEYRIEAVHSNGTSSSNTSTKYTSVKAEPNFVNVIDIAFDGSNVQMNVQTDNTADLLGHALMVSSDNNSYSEAAYAAFDMEESEFTFNHSGDNQPLFYKVMPVMVCNDTLDDANDAVKPIFLEITLSDESQVDMKWNASYIESSETYNIAIAVDGSQETPVSQTNNSLTVLYDNYNENAENFCFNVTASEINGYKSTSNEVCVSRQAKIEAPTGFTPNGDGVNDYFGPFYESGNANSYIKNAVVEQFELIIYDKYGGAVFTTDNSIKRWDGTANYRPVTEGGYIYYLEFTTVQGNTYKKSGTINVVYP